MRVLSRLEDLCLIPYLFLIRPCLPYVDVLPGFQFCACWRRCPDQDQFARETRRLGRFVNVRKYESDQYERSDKKYNGGQKTILELH